MAITVQQIGETLERANLRGAFGRSGRAARKSWCAIPPISNFPQRVVSVDDALELARLIHNSMEAEEAE